LFLFLLLAGTMIASGETLSGSANTAAADTGAQARNAASWEYGPFFNYGIGLGDRSSYKFVWGGAQLGKTFFPAAHAGFFSGQFEYGANVMPLWQAYTPAPHEETFYYPGGSFVGPEGGGTYRGVSITPVIFRWNFQRSGRWQPWAQAAGGLVYTTHKFPPDQLVAKGMAGGTCVWNFTPQGGGGVHYFIHPRRSLDFGVNAVHISSASLGDRNPGVNASVQFQVGYSWWK
jgi:hypothetical protein